MATPSWEASWDAPYGRFEGASRRGLLRARKAWDEGRWETAWRELSLVVRSDPRNLEAASLLQEVEIGWLNQPEAGGDLGPELAEVRATPDPLDALRVVYLERSRAEPSLAHLFLAARIESDDLAALFLLERALEHDPDCAPAHYARAFFQLRRESGRDRWSQAGASLARALQLDPGHLGARRLEAWMLSNAGDVGAASQALESWLRQAQRDPRVSASQRLDARLDLARVWIQLDRPANALRLLARLEPAGSAEARRLSLVACAEEARGRHEKALEAARAAERAGGLGLLPALQQGQLLEEDLGRPEEARADWRRVVDRSVEAGDLASLLASVRARIALERAEQP